MLTKEQLVPGVRYRVVKNDFFYYGQASCVWTLKVPVGAEVTIKYFEAHLVSITFNGLPECFTHIKNLLENCEIIVDFPKMSNKDKIAWCERNQGRLFSFPKDLIGMKQGESGRLSGYQTMYHNIYAVLESKCSTKAVGTAKDGRWFDLSPPARHGNLCELERLIPVEEPFGRK